MENALSEARRRESKGCLIATPCHGDCPEPLRRPFRTENALSPSTLHTHLPPLLGFSSDDGIVESIAYVYILRCRDSSLYIGSTDDLVARLERHNRGEGCTFTASRTPVTLVYVEEHQDGDRAGKRERQIKRWTRAKKEALVAGDLRLLKQL